MYFLGMPPLVWMAGLLTLILSGIASARVQSAFRRWSRVAPRCGMSGAEIARAVLRDQGVEGVRVEAVRGFLSDHYDPRTRTLRLSPQVHGGRSLAAFGVAAHEAGHAIQHARGYAPLRFRSAWVPVASTGTNLSWIVLLLSWLMGGAVAGGLGATLAWIGMALLASVVVFTLVTVPVEYDASRRALLALERGGYLSAEELPAAREVLSAAGLTYVAALAGAILNLLAWAVQLGLLGGRRD